MNLLICSYCHLTNIKFNNLKNYFNLSAICYYNKFDELHKIGIYLCKTCSNETVFEKCFKCYQNLTGGCLLCHNKRKKYKLLCSKCKINL